MTEKLDRWGFPIRPGNIVTIEIVPPPPVRILPVQQGKGSFVEARMLPALRELCEKSPRGKCHTRTEIALACGVDKDTVRGIEKQALKKLRARLGKAYTRQLAECLATQN